MQPAVEPEAPTPPSGGLLVRIHAESLAAMPDGAIATVTLRRPGAQHTAEAPKGRRLTEFHRLEPGRYDLLVAVHSRGVEIGSFKYFVTVGDSVGDVTVRIDYQRADLTVEATVETASERRYVGTATVVSDTCPGPAAHGLPAATDLVLVTDGDDVELTLADFTQTTTRLSGRVVPTGGPHFAAGTFEASDGRAGDWRLLHLSAPARGALAAVLSLDDGTRACETRLEYAGLLEDGHAEAALGAHVAGPTVELVGHGESRSVTLDRSESTAHFEDLLVGPYEVFVGLHQGGEGTLDSRSESVVLGPEGARVATTFEREWAPAATPPLALSADYAPLAGAYHGKSVVTSGAPACIGSIPLADTTELSLEADGRALGLTFDSFYGRVLELAGVAGAAGAPFAASGTYALRRRQGGLLAHRALRDTDRAGACPAGGVPQ